MAALIVLLTHTLHYRLVLTCVPFLPPFSEPPFSLSFLLLLLRLTSRRSLSLSERRLRKATLGAEPPPGVWPSGGLEVTAHAWESGGDSGCGSPWLSALECQVSVQNKQTPRGK